MLNVDFIKNIYVRIYKQKYAYEKYITSIYEYMRIYNSSGIKEMGVFWIFDWGPNPQIICNDVIRNFQKVKIFMRQKYRRIENEKPGPGLAHNHYVTKGRKLEPKVKFSHDI